MTEETIETKSKEEIPGSTPSHVEKPKRAKAKRQKIQTDQDENQGQEDLVEFAGSAIRAQRGGTFETFLSQTLASSLIVTDPLKRVKIVCEAALMVPKEQREDLDIDYDRIDVLNQVTNALLNPTIRNDQQMHIQIVSVCWPFFPAEKNYDKFIRPWFTSNVWYWPFFMKSHCKWHLRDRKIIIDEIIKNPEWNWFFEASDCLAPSGYNALRNNFAAWAIPQVQLYLAELTSLVSPSLYSQVVGLYTNLYAGRKAKSYAEKVKQTTEVSTDEDNLDAGI